MASILNSSLCGDFISESGTITLEPLFPPTLVILSPWFSNTHIYFHRYEPTILQHLHSEVLIVLACFVSITGEP